MRRGVPFSGVTLASTSVLGCACLGCMMLLVVLVPVCSYQRTIKPLPTASTTAVLFLRDTIKVAAALTHMNPKTTARILQPRNPKLLNPQTPRP